MALLRQFKNKYSTCKRNYKLIIILLTPLIALPLPIVIGTKAASCAYVVILMSVYWIFEALPIAVTSLFPVLLFPLLGIAKAEDVAPSYFKDINMLFFGGLVVANAIELSGLHERIALRFLIFFGSNPLWILLGFMLITSFLSLWLSNAPCAAIMLPIFDAVLKKLIEGTRAQHKLEKLPSSEEKISNEANQVSMNLDKTEAVTDIDQNNDVELTLEERKIYIGFMLSCPFSSSIGGLVGHAPNLLLKAYIDKNYPEIKLNFLTYTACALPTAFIMIIISWIWISIKWLPTNCLPFCNKKENKFVNMKPILKEKYNKLGSFRWTEICVGIVFSMQILLWITRDLFGVPGWSYFFKKGYCTDSTPTILALILLFICPKRNIFKGHKYEHLIDWRSLEKIFPWSVLFLFGGALAMADGFKESGLSDWIGYNLNSLYLPQKELKQFIVILISAIITEFTSNTSVSAIFLPIVDSMAKQSQIHPIYLMLPLTLSVSLAFMLPVATATNAIIFASGHVKVRDMIKTGFVMNIIGLATIYLASNTWLIHIFNIKFPYNYEPDLYKNNTSHTQYNTTNLY